MKKIVMLDIAILFFLRQNFVFINWIFFALVFIYFLFNLPTCFNMRWNILLRVRGECIHG